MKTKELWKPIIGFDGYEISNYGRVRSFWSRKNYFYSFIGKTFKILKPSINRDGYYTVSLRKNKKTYKTTIHSIVLDVFKKQRPNGLYGLHNNGDKLDNRIENLRWGTQQDNCDDRETHGNTRRGDKHHNAKLNNINVKKIRKLLSKNVSVNDVAKLFNMHRSSISAIKHRRYWRHI